MNRKVNLIPGLVCSAGLALCSPAVAAGQATIFTGNILTMDSNNPVAAAVGVDDRGLIVAVGGIIEVSTKMQHLKPVTKKLGAGETMLPGFIDPHLHIVSMALTYSGLIDRLGPCLPQPYKNAEAEDCQATIKGALEKLENFTKGRSTPVIGMELDPSRQPYSDTETAIAFKADPAKYIAEIVSDTTPVLIIDQSGHFGYVNTAAFQYLQKKYKDEGLKWPPEIENGGEWVPKDPKEKSDGSPESYTGLLLEIDGYTPFLEAFLPAAAKGLKPKDAVAGSQQALAIYGGLV